MIKVLTDGQSTFRENDWSLVYARENGIKIFTIGLGSQVEENTIRMIASKTSGKYLFDTSADDVETLFDELTAHAIYLYTDILIVMERGYLTILREIYVLRME